MNRNAWLNSIATRLDRLRHVQTDVLADLVQRHDTCLWTHFPGDPPEVTGHDNADRELAARLCAECPAQDECLELELRTTGTETVGVWGGMSEQDRRDLYPFWRTRRDNPHEPDVEGATRDDDRAPDAD